MTKVAFRDRLKAWWDGYDPHQAAVDRAGANQANAAADAGEAARPRKHARYGPLAETLHLLFGEGYHLPGGFDFMASMVARTKLRAGHSALVIGCGTGGMARDLADHYRVTVAGLEPWRPLAKVGIAMSQDEGAGSHIRVGPANLEHLDLTPDRNQVVLAREVFHQAADRFRLYRAVERTLRKHATLVFTQYVAARDDADRAELARRIATPFDVAQPPLLTDREEHRQMIDCGMEPFIAENVSERIVQAALEVFADWQRVVEAIADYAEQPRMLKELLEIVECWQRRIDALQSGEVKVYLYHAAKLGKDMP